jgi:SAM-dependent methyltransferase
MADESRAYYAATYDVSVPDWPREIDFYLRAAQAAEPAEVLELAVGTGRVAARLAQAGWNVTGLDRSPEMLAVARAKTAGLPNLRLVEADMRSYDLGRRFGLVIIPGHSFQNLLTADDQLACLRATRRHLDTNGRLIIHLDHQDTDWLGAISQGGRLAGVFEPAESFRHPDTGRQVKTNRAWSYRRLDQAAIVTTVWQELAEDGSVVAQFQLGPTPVHCIFRYEMEHLLGRAGFEVESLFGDFLGNPLTDSSTDMVWQARRP